MFKAFLPMRSMQNPIAINTQFAKMKHDSHNGTTHFKEGEEVLWEFRPGKRFTLTFFLLATVAPPLTELGSAPPLHAQHIHAGR